MLPTKWSDGILSDAFANTWGENGRLSLCPSLQETGRCILEKLQISTLAPEKDTILLSLSLSLSQFANGLSPPFSPMFYTRSSLLFIFNRICKNFFNIWIYPDRTEIKIANINARSKKILFPFFSLFSQFTNGLFLYVDILCIFFFYSFSTVYVKLSLTFGYRCGSRSLHSFNLLSVYNPKIGQTRSHEFDYIVSHIFPPPYFFFIILFR